MNNLKKTTTTYISFTYFKFISFHADNKRSLSRAETIKILSFAPVKSPTTNKWYGAVSCKGKRR